MLPPKQYCDLSNNSVIKATAPCVCKIWLQPLYWVMSHVVDHCITTLIQSSKLHYCHRCNTALMLPPKQHCELSNNSVIKAIAPCVCKIWLPPLLSVASWITVSLYGSNFRYCTIAIGVTQLWCFHPNKVMNCPITQLLRQLHPAFAKFGCHLCIESWVT
jgi:hypothetical protein